MKILATLSFLLLSLSSFAQVPDWTDSSCNGNTYNMYDLLANGNAVILDFSAIWCGPCQASAPELQTIWENYDSGAAGVMVFDFLLQDASGNEADCGDVASWESSLSLTYPGFGDPLVDSIWNLYNVKYGNGGIPLILLFIPNINDPGASSLVYNYATSLGANTGDISDDISSLLHNYGYWGIGLEETSMRSERKLSRIIDYTGRETIYKPNTPLIYMYDDGSIERVFKPEF